MLPLPHPQRPTQTAAEAIDGDLPVDGMDVPRSAARSGQVPQPRSDAPKAQDLTATARAER
jgi:hypothetical protein